MTIRGVGLNFFGYTPKLAQFADTVSRDVGDLSFWTAIPPSVIVNCKDRLLRTFKSCKFSVFVFFLTFVHGVMFDVLCYLAHNELLFYIVRDIVTCGFIFRGQGAPGLTV